MRNFFTIILIIVTSAIFGQTAKDSSLTAVLKSMQNVNVYEISYTVGYAGLPSQQAQLYKKLVSIASESDLIQIAGGDHNAVVRLYAYRALTKKSKVIPPALAKKFDSDRAIVTVAEGCIRKESLLSSLYNIPLIFEADVK